MVRQELVNSIIRYLAILEVDIQKHNKLGLTDINRIAEGIVAPLINEVLQCQLGNLNSLKLNYPAIDLGDPEKGIAVQVTSSREPEKIYSTLAGFLRHEADKKVYNTLYIFILTNETAKYNAKKITEVIDGHPLQFSGKEHIINFSFIEKSLDNLSDIAVGRIHGILRDKMQDNMIFVEETSHKNERHQLDALRNNSRLHFNLQTAYFEFNFERIEADILPAAKILGHSESAERNTLDEVILKSQGKSARHIVLVAEGGAGKTSSLLWTWNKLLEDKAGPVPLYISLPDLENTKTTLPELIKQHYYKVSTAATKLEDVLLKTSKENGQPKVILLLDAFNQLSKHNKILHEITECCKAWQGVQMVIASRHPINFAQLQNFDTVELLPLSTERVKTYIREKVGAERIISEIMALLSNPMRLTMFCQYSLRRELIEKHIKESSSEYTDGVKARFRLMDIHYNKGDLCWDYFESLVAYETIPPRKKLSTELLYIILEELLPVIGYTLESSGRFSLHKEELQALINEYAQKHPEHILNLEAAVRRFMVEGLNILHKKDDVSFSFSHHEFRDYFSAAYKNKALYNWVETLKTKKFSYTGIPSFIKDEMLASNISYYLGAINEEHRNVPLYKEGTGWDISHYKNESVLRQSLQVFRKKFNGKKLKYAVQNLMGIILSSKDDLAGDDFSHLYLKGINFSTKNLSRIDGIISKALSQQHLGCNFDKSQIDLLDFMPRTHEPARKFHIFKRDMYDNIIISLRIEYTAGKPYLYSGTKSEVIKWDLQEWKAVEKLSIPYIYDFSEKKRFGHDGFYAFHPVDHFLQRTGEALTVTKDNYLDFYTPHNQNFLHRGYVRTYHSDMGWLGIWDIQKHTLTRSYDIFKGGWYCLGKEDELLAFTHPNGTDIQVWQDKGLVATYTANCMIKPCAFRPGKDVLLLTDAEGKTFEWDYVLNKRMLEFNFSSFDEYILGYDPSGSFIVTSSCKYLYANKNYNLTDDVFDFSSIKDKDFGRLGFWSTADGELKKELDPGIGAEIVTKILFHTIEDNTGSSKSILIIGNRVGAVKLIDHDDLISLKTLCPEVYRLYPITGRYIPFSRSFISTYRNGLIRKFESTTHKCEASARGKLTTPDGIYFSPLVMKMALRELITGKVEIWNMENLTQEHEIDSFKDILIWDMRFNQHNDRLYVLGEIAWSPPHEKSFDEMNMEELRAYAKVMAAIPNILYVYDLKEKKLLKTIQLYAQVLDWDFCVQPSEKAVLYISKHDRTKLIVYDLELDKLQAYPLPFEVKMTGFGKTGYHSGVSSIRGLFTLIDTDGGMYYCEYHEDQGIISHVMADKISEATEFTSYDIVTGLNGVAVTLFCKDLLNEHPRKHERYEFDRETQTLTKVAENVEVIDKDVFVGDPYYTERVYDYQPETGTELIFFQNSTAENFLVERGPSLKADFITQHGNSDSINVAGCKFPFIYTELDSSARELAWRLEKNGATFPLSYHIMNYPHTYQVAANESRLMVDKLTIVEKIRLWFSLFLLNIINRTIRLFTFRRKNKYRRQNPDNPYIILPRGNGGDRYYPSEPYDWV